MAIHRQRGTSSTSISLYLSTVLKFLASGSGATMHFPVLTSVTMTHHVLDSLVTSRYGILSPLFLSYLFLFSSLSLPSLITICSLSPLSLSRFSRPLSHLSFTSLFFCPSIFLFVSPLTLSVCPSVYLFVCLCN